MADDIQNEDGAGSKASKVGKRPRHVTVSIVERQGQSVIVQHETRRYFAPADKINGNEIDAADLKRCTLYGEDWSTWDNGARSQEFAEQLYATGIYTKRDLLARSGEARASLQRLYVNSVFSDMLNRASGG